MVSLSKDFKAKFSGIEMAVCVSEFLTVTNYEEVTKYAADKGLCWNINFQKQNVNILALHAT